MTTQLIDVLHDLDLSLMEKANGLLTPEGERIITQFAQDLSGYFNELAEIFPYSKLDALVSQYGPPAKPEEPAESFWEQEEEELVGLTTAAEAIAVEAVRAYIRRLGILSYRYLLEGYDLGGKSALQLLGMVQLNLVDEGAKVWARGHAAELMRVVDQVTTDRLSKTIYEGIRTGQSPQALAKTIRADLAWQADAYKGRPMTIARTEIANAHSEAALRTYERLGVEYKSWSRAAASDFDCDICQGNEDEGIIPMGEVFSSGDPRPPSHPNCLCVLVPESKGPEE